MAAVTAALMTLPIPSARAVSPAAQAKFQEGRQLMAAGKISEACARFAQSYELEASSGTLLNLALCHEKEGKTATAWAEYREAARLAQDQGRKDRAAAANDKAAALEPKVPRITIVAAKPVSELVVAAEQRSLTEGGFGVAVPIDPGVHPITASAPHHRSWTTTVKISDSEQRTLEIPALEEEPAPAAMPAVAKRAENPQVVIAPRPAPPRKPPSRVSSLEVYAAVGGGALVVAGTVVYLFAYQKFESAKNACNPRPGCPDYDARVSSISTLKEIAIGSWIAGGAAIAASAVHFGYRTRKRPLEVAIDPWGGRFVIRGVF